MKYIENENEYQLKILLEGLKFPESPRWHDNKLWFSDMLGKKVITVDLEGQSEVILEMEDMPSGLGWLPNGRLIVVSMQKGLLLSLEAGVLKEYANLKTHSIHKYNDMVINKNGNAYVGNFGFDLDNKGWMDYKPSKLVLVEPNGNSRVVAEDMGFPNGSVIYPDGNTIVVAETRNSQLTAFDIQMDGSLTNRRIWAKLECDKFPVSYCQVPDGICLDEKYGVWVTSPNSSEVIRVLEGGEVTDRIKLRTPAFACMLGGKTKRNILFLCTSTSYSPDAKGKIEYTKVKIPGKGLP